MAYPFPVLNCHCTVAGPTGPLPSCHVFAARGGHVFASSFGPGTSTASKMMNDAVVTAATEKVPGQLNHCGKGCVNLVPLFLRPKDSRNREIHATNDGIILKFRVCCPMREREGGTEEGMQSSCIKPWVVRS